MKSEATSPDVSDVDYRGQLSIFSNSLAIVYAVGGLLLFYYLRNVVAQLNWNPEFIVPVAVLTLLGALLFARVGYQKLPGVFSVLTRSSAVGILVYLIVEPPDFTLADSASSHLAAYVTWGYWIALPIAVLGIWRPSFLYPAAFYVITTRYVVDNISGFNLSTLDIRYMIEMAQFLSLSACAIALIRVLGPRLVKQKESKTLELVDLQLLALCLAYIAIGFHLGNYFWSGFAKLVLGPEPWSWALENPTQNIMLGALKRGVLPSGAMPGVTQALFDGFGRIASLSNIIVLITQLFALVVVLRIGWLRVATLAYDGLHVGIYILGGLFFWPWVWNNLSILLAVRRTSDQQIGWAPKVCCIIAILLGGGVTLGSSAKLAWWDVTDIKIPMIQAQAESGAWVDVPVSYFLSHSYAVSHGYVDLAQTQGHYLPTQWGSARRYERAKTSGRCPETSYIDNVESSQARAERLERVGKFLRAHHRKMAQRANEGGHNNFYLRSHHHPSNPWMYRTFNDLDVRKIKRYRVLTQSVCMALSDGRLIERIIKEDAVTFDTDG